MRYIKIVSFDRSTFVRPRIIR